MCLVPLPPDGYDPPVHWPDSKEKILYKNVEHPKLAAFVKEHTWVMESGEYLTFPQNQSEIKGGVLHYLESIEEMVPDLEWGKNIRVVLDIGVDPEIPLPNEQSRMEILKIHAAGIAKHGEIDYEAVVKLAEGFNGADLWNVCTEAGMSAIRAELDYVIHEDFMKICCSPLATKGLGDECGPCPCT